MSASALRTAARMACLALAPLLATGCVMSRPNNGDHIGTLLTTFQAEGYHATKNVTIHLECFNHVTKKWDYVAGVQMDATPVYWGGANHYRWRNNAVWIPPFPHYWQWVDPIKRRARFRAYDVSNGVALKTYDNWSWAFNTSSSATELYDKATGEEVELTATLF